MRTTQKSLILFGEGKSEAVFLSHLRAIYRSELLNVRINVDAGSGGSPQCVANRLIRQHLDLKSSNGALLLIDSDITIGPKLRAQLKDRSVKILFSKPVCLEGLFLKLLDDEGPKKEKCDAGKLKKYFQEKYLKTGRKSKYIAKLKKACPELFTKPLIEQKRSENQTLKEILAFMGI